MNELVELYPWIPDAVKVSYMAAIFIIVSCYLIGRYIENLDDNWGWFPVAFIAGGGFGWLSLYDHFYVTMVTIMIALISFAALIVVCMKITKMGSDIQEKKRREKYN